MKRSLKIGRFFGIDVFVHWSFLLLVGWVILHYLSAGAGLGGALYAAGFVGAIFGCVVLHELGHSLAARLFGIETRHITLLPIGGVASLTGMPRKLSQEIIIALAGPAVNVAIAALLSPLALFSTGFLRDLWAANIVLVVFNLIPAFPMDGGRVLRAALAHRLPYGRATHIAARIGQGFAVLLGLFGFFVLHNPFSLLVAFFVFSAAAAERQAVLLAEQRGIRFGGIPQAPRPGTSPEGFVRPGTRPGGGPARVVWTMAPPVTQWSDWEDRPPVRDVTPPRK